MKAALIVLILLPLLVGCGGPKQGQLPTAQVTGEVTYRGTPLGHGEIKFIPLNASGAGVRVAYGTTDGQGRYRLGTYGQGDGAILGDYQVAMEAREEISADTAQHATNLAFGEIVPDCYNWTIRMYGDSSIVQPSNGITVHPIDGLCCRSAGATWGASMHPSGMNGSMADGSVCFVNETIDMNVFMSLGTINGGESVTAPLPGAVVNLAVRWCCSLLMDKDTPTGKDFVTARSWWISSSRMRAPDRPLS